MHLDEIIAISFPMEVSALKKVGYMLPPCFIPGYYLGTLIQILNLLYLIFLDLLFRDLVIVVSSLGFLVKN